MVKNLGGRLVMDFIEVITNLPLYLVMVVRSFIFKELSMTITLKVFPPATNIFEFRFHYNEWMKYNKYGMFVYRIPFSNTIL